MSGYLRQDKVAKVNLTKCIMAKRIARPVLYLAEDVPFSDKIIVSSLLQLDFSVRVFYVCGVSMDKQCDVSYQRHITQNVPIFFPCQGWV